MRLFRLGFMVVLLFVGVSMALDVEDQVPMKGTPTDTVTSGIDGVTVQIDSLSAVTAESAGIPWRGVSVILAFFVLVQTIVRLTPTPKDDEIASRFGRILNAIMNGTRIRGAEAEKAARSVESQIVAKLAREDPKRIAEIARDAAGRVISTVEQYGIRNDGVPTISHAPSEIALGAVKSAVENRTMRTRFGRAVQKLFSRVL